MYWAPRSAVQLGFEGLLLVDIRPPQPRALSQMETLREPSESRAEVTPLVKPPPTTARKVFSYSTVTVFFFRLNDFFYLLFSIEEFFRLGFIVGNKLIIHRL